MAFQDSLLDQAFEVYGAFGQTNKRDGLKNAFLQLSLQDIDILLARMKEVLQTVDELAQRGGESKLGRVAVIASLQEKHPFLTGRGLDRALFGQLFCLA